MILPTGYLTFFTILLGPQRNQDFSCMLSNNYCIDKNWVILPLDLAVPSPVHPVGFNSISSIGFIVILIVFYRSNIKK